MEKISIIFFHKVYDKMFIELDNNIEASYKSKLLWPHTFVELYLQLRIDSACSLRLVPFAFLRGSDWVLRTEFRTSRYHDIE